MVAFIHVHMSVHLIIFTFKLMHTFMSPSVTTFMSIFVFIYIHINIHIYMHICIHIIVHIIVHLLYGNAQRALGVLTGHGTLTDTATNTTPSPRYARTHHGTFFKPNQHFICTSLNK
jgi:hypothetical protein